MLEEGFSLNSNPPDGDGRGGPSVHLETFGCQMNVLDSQLVRGQLQGLGYRFVDDWRAADVVLYNTCSVRQHAEEKVYSRLGLARIHKAERPEVVLGLIGCMAEREGTAITRRFGHIDVLCGPGELDRLPMLIDNAIRTAPGHHGRRRATQVALQGNTHRRSATLGAAEDRLELLDLARSFSPDEHRGSAYVRITRGCNKFCTYCVVPRTRGAEVHRPAAHIIEECRRLADSGVVEITLLGQTVNHYRYDHGAAIAVRGIQQPQVGAAVREALRPTADRRVTTFADLLGLIHEQVPGLQRLRFVTSFPRDFGDDILQVMRACPRICRYLHLPVQSGSDRILQLMNRDYTVGLYADLLARIREHLPDATVASDLICGFPTESEADHAASCDLLRQSGFKNCFVFKYSPRPDTAAMARFGDDVPEAAKRERNNELLAIQGDVSAAVHRRLIGRTLPVFVESVSERTLRRRSRADAAVEPGWDRPRPVTQMSGRTGGDLIVMLEGDESLVGSIVPVQIESAAPLALFGRLAAPA